MPLILLVGCTWRTKPGLPLQTTDDVPVSALDDHALSFDTGARWDTPQSPDAPPLPTDAPTSSADALTTLDISTDVPDSSDCRFVPLHPGEMPPANAVQSDGGYYANRHGEICDPAPIDTSMTDASASIDVGMTDAPVDAPLTPGMDGGQP